MSHLYINIHNYFSVEDNTFWRGRVAHYIILMTIWVYYVGEQLREEQKEEICNKYFPNVKWNIEDDIGRWFYNQSHEKSSVVLHIPYARRRNWKIHAITRRIDIQTLNTRAQRRRKALKASTFGLESIRRSCINT